MPFTATTRGRLLITNAIIEIACIHPLKDSTILKEILKDKLDRVQLCWHHKALYLVYGHTIIQTARTLGCRYIMADIYELSE